MFLLHGGRKAWTMFVGFFWPGVAWVGFGIEGPIVLSVGSWGVTDIAVDARPNFLQFLAQRGKIAPWWW